MVLVFIIGFFALLTIWGAVKIALYSYAIGMGRALTGGRFPKTG